MKQVVHNCISDELANRICCMKSEEEWVMAKSLIADAYNLIIEQTVYEQKDPKEMAKWHVVLMLLCEHQSIIDLFHKEAKNE